VVVLVRTFARRFRRASAARVGLPCGVLGPGGQHPAPSPLAEADEPDDGDQGHGADIGPSDEHHRHAEQATSRRRTTGGRRADPRLCSTRRASPPVEPSVTIRSTILLTMVNFRPREGPSAQRSLVCSAGPHPAVDGRQAAGDTHRAASTNRTPRVVQRDRSHHRTHGPAMLAEPRSSIATPRQ
jgi:hypothetical protein